MVWDVSARRNRSDGNAAFFSSPAIVGNRVYLSTATMSVFGNGSGRIVCLDADSGQEVWSGGPDNYAATFSSPVIAGEYLVCGEGLHKTQNARIICLSLKEGQHGRVLWTHRTSSHVERTPVVVASTRLLRRLGPGNSPLAIGATSRTFGRKDAGRHADARTRR